MCIEQAKELLRKEYHSIWNNWFDKYHLSPAELIIEAGGHSSGYVHKENILFVFLPVANLREVIDDLVSQEEYYTDYLGWPVWKRELIHEVLHEYQFKVIRHNVSREGRKLYDKYKLKFSGQGHDLNFFTAIADRADYFHMTPDKLIDNL